jgi:carboxypeptidase Q
MKNMIAKIASVALTAGIAQTSFAIPPAPMPTPDEQAIDAATKDMFAWDIIQGLTTEVGPRLAGTEAEARARRWAAFKLPAMGFANVRIEPYKMQTWVRGEETAEVLQPYPQKLIVTALGNSGSTGKAAIQGEVVYFANLQALQAAPVGSVKGKIVFVSHNMKPAQDGSGYGPFGQVRRIGPNIAAKMGATAIIIRSIGTDNHRVPHTGNTNFEKSVTPIPAAALSIPDADNLVRMFATNAPVQIKLILTPKFVGETESGNVIAEVPGNNPKLPPIIIACHLDSWDLGTGAIDDAAGCGIIAAAAKHLRDTGPRLRTIRILWAGAEEVGGFGGKAYAEAHKTEPHGLAMESDFGADRVWRVDFKLPESAKALQTKIADRFAYLGIQTGKAEAGGGTDVEPIIEAQHLSVIDLQQDGTHYFDLHHTADDTLDKIDLKQLQQNVTAWTVVLMNVANYEGDLSLAPKP